VNKSDFHLKEKNIREPFFHILKRDAMPFWKSWLIRIIAVLLALLVCGILSTLLIHQNPIRVYASMINGCFGSERRIWKLLQGIAVLLCIALAVTPAFKMQFWNTGAEGQVLVGGLATAAVMYYGKLYFGTDLPTWILILAMVIASVLAGAIWGVIPAIFKARWNTNETLFTLMMNYVAIQLVNFCINVWVKNGSGKLQPMYDYGLPRIPGYNYLLNILIVAVLTIVIYIYLKYSKQGYEIAVVGQSQNTARYVGINVRKVVIRTMLLSGSICGIAGLILVGGTDYTVNQDTVGGRGFTAIMVSWLAKFNPLFMVLTSFLVVFLQQGASQLASDFHMDEAFSDIITGIILFFIIGSEFFINYEVVFRHGTKKLKKTETNTDKEEKKS
jgi:simple sugar transport system permease protein